MQSRRDGSSVSTSIPTPPNAFESSFLAQLQEDGEPLVCGWLARYQPEIVTALHHLEGLARVPQGLAEVLRAAGPGALAQIGRILAVRQPD